MGMPRETRHVSEWIDRPAEVVYAFVSDPANVPAWAAGLGGAVERDGDEWFVDSPMGRVGLRFAPPNEFGVLDHDVTLPSGEVFLNPMRVVPDGDACEVVFTLRRQPGMTDEEFARDSAAVAADLGSLKRILEGGT
jgi:hypothetical protein